MLNVFQVVIKTTKLSVSIPNTLRKCCLSSVAPTVHMKSSSAEANSNANHMSNTNKNISNKTKNIVAAAFASLKHENFHPSAEIHTPFTDDNISKATTIDELLSLSEGSGISRSHALKVVSILSEWTGNGKIVISDFETDYRFIKLCRVLAKNMNPRPKVGLRSEDLSTIISVTADDEAAKLVENISLPQMIRVMSSLSQKKRRSTMLLRALAFNLTKCRTTFDLKQSADLLYSMAVLNFPDENLLERIVVDICQMLETNVKKSAPVGSILTSLGLLKYKDTGLLDSLSNWILKNNNICRSQDIFALFLTLGALNYKPAMSDKLFEVLLPELSIADASKKTEWLQFIWSLVILNNVSANQISTVLSDDFLTAIEGEGLSVSSKLKLLNINAYAKLLLANYDGPRLKQRFEDLRIPRSKEKQELSTAVFDALQNLMQSDKYFKKDFNTGMGFYIDGHCVLDSKGNPLPLEKVTPDDIKVAIMVYDYHDMCKGTIDITGINALYRRILKTQNYKILTVPYTEFHPRDKLVQRVKYIETKIKSLATS